ncbi:MULTISPECIES: sulfotransferase family protein [Thiorhodovibrio]|uniref:sulfotransferase family protein n=1 Tax=Thiorhodovibrio TaxID=61593 RepID=UPI001911E38D|nr:MULTISPECIES: sulfotransferase [Thiorhodovibrio]MBK5969272.1 sulfotransferase [Thiorhodovibrio winogradskyi]WPL11263.1 hypothetical protein Thiosp_00995 [Thiorhodovibrio litoralis]
MKQRPQPVLMIPLRRCGSHALRLRLNFSPEFYSPYPIHVVDFMPLLPKYGDLTKDHNYFQLIVDLIGLQNATMVKWSRVALDPVMIFEALHLQPRGIHMVLWEMLLQAGEQHHAKVVMDKSLDSVVYAEELFAAQPELRFLNVVRDPRAQISSMNQAIIYDFDTLLNTQRWVSAHQAARALQEKYPQRVLTIRFEDFIADQESILRKICDFLNITFLPAMLDISCSREAREISSLSSLWETNVYSPIAANIDKFKQLLSEMEIELIETLTADFMALYAYEKITPARAQVSKADIQAAHARSDENKNQAWVRLKQHNMYDYLLRRFRNDYLDNLARRFSSVNFGIG